MKPEPAPEDQQLEELFRLAREAPPAPVVEAELGFQTRLLAGLRAERERLRHAPERVVWRLAPALGAIMLCVSTYSLLLPGRGGASLDDLAAWALGTDYLNLFFL